jgi:hypothetical protein
MANTTIQIKHSTVAGNVPATLANGEISINSADGKIFYAKPNGAIFFISTDTATGPAGLNGEVQFNDSGVLGSTANLSIIKANGTVTIGGSVRVAGSPGDAAFVTRGSNGKGGAGYHGFLEANNTTATNGAKHFRINSTGGMEVVNSGYTSTILSLTDAGVLSTPALATTGYVQFSDGTRQYTANAGSGGGTVTSVGGVSGAISNTQLVGFITSVPGAITFDSVITSNNGNGTNFRVGDDAWIGDYNASNSIKIKGLQDPANAFISFGTGDATALGRAGTGPLTYGGQTVWHAGNDGAGSGLDADLLDGLNSTSFANTATTDAINVTQNNSITASFTQANLAIVNALSASNYANGAFAVANAATTTNLTQNNSLTAAFVQANAAYTRANNSLNANTGGTITGNVIISSNVTITGNGASLTIQSNTAFVSPNTQNTITMRMLNGGTLSFSGNAGELFSITDSMAAGSIFSVNDISGLPVIDVDANGWISMAQYGGNVHIYNAATSVSNSTGALVVDGGVGVRGNVYADAVYDGGVEVIAFANAAFNTANAAFISANLANGVDTTQNNSITAAFIAANSAGIYANGAFTAANAAVTLSAATDLTQNNSITASFIAANSAGIYANGAFAAANSAATLSAATDLTQNNSITASFVQANAAYTRANNSINANTGGTITGDLIVTGNFTVSGATTYANTTSVQLGDNIITLNAELPVSVTPSENSGIEINRGNTLANASLLWVEASGKWQANSGSSTGAYFLGSEAAVTSAGIYANGAFAAANAATTTNTTQNNSITAAFTTANSAAIYANGAFAAANAATATDTTQNNSITAAFTAANSAGVYANGAFATANAASTTNITQNNSITAAFTRANNSLNANTGGTITGNVSITGNLTISYNSSISYANSNGVVSVYQVYNQSTNSLDTVFV